MNENGSGHDSTDQDIRRVCSILESIANRYPIDSEEAAAIKDAALAYIVVQQRTALKTQYCRLRLACGGELSEEAKARLRKVGIDPDALEAECESDQE